MAAFYELPEAERIARTEQAIKDGTTILERWTALASQEAEPWNQRAAAAAAWLAGAVSVADLGCGTMILERHLAPGTAYYPCDVVARDHRTTVCDLNRDPPPPLPAQAVACLGLIEYLHLPARFMQQIAQQYATCVISYCITDALAPLEPRRGHAWVNAFARQELEDLFTTNGWTVQKYRLVDEFQALWLLHRA